MTLAIGTALQNGNYVIDALGSEDSIGPVYLATHVPSGQWVMVRVLGSRHPERIPTPDQRSAFYQYLVNVSDLGHALLPQRLRGFEEEGVCYQTLSLPLGAPLIQGITPTAPAALQPSLALIHQLIDALKAMQTLGWAGITLTPDQLWQAADGKTFTFLGFNFPTSAPQPQDYQELALVQGLTRLLYFLLTGCRAEETRAPLAVDLRQRRPELPMSLDRAFQWDFHSSDRPAASWLDEWRALLPSPAHRPEAVTASPQTVLPSPPIPTPALATVVASAAPSPGIPASSGPTPVATPERSGMTTPQPRRGLPRLALWALLGTGLISGLSGLTFGLQARLQPLGTDSPARFNPNQSFPPLPDWDGGATATDRFSPSPRQRVQPDYGSSPPMQATPMETEQRPSAPVEPVELPTNTDGQPSPMPDPMLETDLEYGVESLSPSVEPDPQPQPTTAEGSEVRGESGVSSPDPSVPTTPVAPAPINIQPAPSPAAPPAPLAPPAPVPVTPDSPTPLTSS